MTLVLPADVQQAIEQQATLIGTTPELFVAAQLRQLFPVRSTTKSESLEVSQSVVGKFDFLRGSMTQEDVEEFERLTAATREVDEELWK